MPRRLVEALERTDDADRRAWMMSLSATVHYLETHWSLTLGEPYQPGGQTAWVAPARTEAGKDLVLKVGWRHPEGEHEGEGLRAWAGQGAVVVHATQEFEDTIALLIERCVPGTTLSSRPETEQDAVIASLLPRIWRQPRPDHPFRMLEEMCETWAEECERKMATRPVDLDPGLAREGIGLFRTLPASAERRLLLCTDLHAENVLAAEREPWLMIDPKPYVGDPTYDPLQHLLNCGDRLRANPSGLARRMADRLGLDGDRLVLWLFARCVQESPGCPQLAYIARQIAPT